MGAMLRRRCPMKTMTMAAQREAMRKRRMAHPTHPQP
jgi:hypothetical protein